MTTQRTLPELAPLPGQVDAALRSVHERRRRSAVLAASGAGAAVLVSLAVGSGIGRLGSVDSGPPGVVRSASPGAAGDTAR